MNTSRFLALAALRCSAACTVMSSLGCAGRGAPPKLASVRFAGDPPGASVVVDDHLVGTLDVVAARGLALPVGKHQISVESPGYFPWDKEIEASAGKEPLRLDVHLRAIPD